MRNYLASSLLLLAFSWSALAAEMKGLPLVAQIEWLDLDASSQRLYVSGALESWSFLLYGALPENDERRQQEFSDFTSCAEAVPFEVFEGQMWLWGDVERSGAAELAKRLVPLRCEKYKGKGDGTRRPARLVARSTWESSTRTQRIAYLSGYLDLQYEVMGRVEGGEDQRTLNACMAKYGPRGVLAQLSTGGSVDIEWQHPLPWSVSQALGKTCAEFLEKAP